MYISYDNVKSLYHAKVYVTCGAKILNLILKELWFVSVPDHPCKLGRMRHKNCFTLYAIAKLNCQ